ncbi:RagB/SusD family nutrient uptake outer membrane protein [uncultured Butyricimonas sp.]|uniref:RagB/SusD family nutrient uptake outer membrane protein n=1 Tax=uncultured Butyricimonas sp. TaxID=1268785 RepID=UPI0026DB56A0|nr:RagB/SusD family nutrient uptake outer membrane protein [uncultured Butyricimonas sp.]
MKIDKYIILPLFVVLCACNDFLDYKDKDKVIPSKFDEYSELIYGELIHKESGASCLNLLIMSDDIGSLVEGNKEDQRREYLNWYCWAENSQITPDGVEKIDPAWEFLYHKILMCNVIENEVGAMEDDLEGVKYRLLGEVQAIRAMSYWYLVNMYGEPWRSEEQAKTAMGVPVNIEVSIKDNQYTRETLARNYEIMETDLKNALMNLEKGEKKNTAFRPNKDVVRLFLSRIYLEQSRYEDVITVCNDLLSETTRIIVPLAWMKGNNDSWWYDYPMVSRDAGSLLFTWWTRDAVPTFGSSSSVGRFCVSLELKELVKEYPNDLRGMSYTLWDYSAKTIYKYHSPESKCYGMNYRLEEAYYNRAEAYICVGKWELAMNDLTSVYRERVLNETDPKLEASDAEEAMKIFRKEKRKEFCFEDIRWFDIRRWGLSVEHEYHDINDSSKSVTYVLEAESPNYVLPLPLDVQRLNDKIERLKRVEAIVK